MKKLLTVLFVLCLFSAFTANAQKKLTEGTITYDIIINTGSDKPQNVDFLDGATSAVYIKGGKSRTEMVSPLGTQSTIMDAGKNTIVILKEYGDQRYMINLTADNWKDANKRFENVTFTYEPSAVKTIQGFKCTKAVGLLPDGTSFTVWYTTDLIVESKDFQYANRNLPGLALEYETNMGNLKVTYTVSKINFSPVPAAKFDIPKSGYRILSYEESKSGG
jgi:GLPGLI family protein